MKMESINGGILPIVKIAGEKPIDEDDEEELLDEEAEEPENKKRKITRKKRSLNWEEAERALLVEIIKPKVDYVENRSVDSNSSKAKRLAWLQITKQFNALNFRHRALEQIQVQWRSMKVFAKREFKDKSPKNSTPEGLELLEFMEQIHQEPVVTRSQNRGSSIVEKSEQQQQQLPKKEEPATEEETAAPSSNEPVADTSPNHEEPLIQASQSTLPSPPLSESQSQSQSLDNQFELTALNDIKNQKLPQQQPIQRSIRVRRPRAQNSFQNEAAMAATDTLYKKEVFDLMKQARVSEMEYARREHDEKLKFLQQEQELKLECFRREEELKLQLMKEEHDARMLHSKLEHEVKMVVWSRYKSPTPTVNQK